MNSPLIEGMAAVAIEPLHRSIGQRARRAKESIAKSAKRHRAALSPEGALAHVFLKTAAPHRHFQPRPHALGERQIMTTWADEYLTMLDDCEEREARLTDWERGFVDSLRHQINAGRRPSQKQLEALESCWERATARG